MSYLDFQIVVLFHMRISFFPRSKVPSPIPQRLIVFVILLLEIDKLKVTVHHDEDRLQMPGTTFQTS